MLPLAACACFRYETNEILVVSMRQQIKELESQLESLRQANRDQLLALSKVRAVNFLFEVFVFERFDWFCDGW